MAMALALTCLTPSTPLTYRLVNEHVHGACAVAWAKIYRSNFPAMNYILPPIPILACRLAGKRKRTCNAVAASWAQICRSNCPAINCPLPPIPSLTCRLAGKRKRACNAVAVAWAKIYRSDCPAMNYILPPIPSLTCRLANKRARNARAVAWAHSNAAARALAQWMEGIECQRQRRADKRQHSAENVKVLVQEQSHPYPCKLYPSLSHSLPLLLTLSSNLIRTLARLCLRCAFLAGSGMLISDLSGRTFLSVGSCCSIVWATFMDVKEAHVCSWAQHLRTHQLLQLFTPHYEAFFYGSITVRSRPLD
eukprot:1159519-Pelagomonas_calceolata.AAC.11